MSNVENNSNATTTISACRIFDSERARGGISLHVLYILTTMATRVSLGKEANSESEQ
jgi:hypothetical protein